MTNPDKIFGRLGNRLFQMAYIYAQVKEGKLDDIYAQDYRLFDKYGDEVKKLFGEGIGYLPYVAIHLRVGGNPVNPQEPKYIDNPFYCPLAKTGYYIDAISKFPNRKFLVFSDDVSFAKTYFEGDKFAFDETTDDVECLNRMASCSDFIIANSSFSYWAAYLSPSIGKKVIAPTVDKWFNDGIERTVCPPEWIRV
jgi:hypothetical protein